MLKNAACSVAYVFYQLQTKRFTPDSQDPTCTRSHQAFRSWWFALWVEWQHQKLHTHTHTRSFPSCQKSLTKYTARLITRLMQHEHAAVHLAGNAAAVMKTSPHLNLHLRWLSSLFVSRSSPPPMERQEKESSSALCQVWLWRVFLNFGTVLLAPGLEMWPPKQGW